MTDCKATDDLLPMGLPENANDMGRDCTHEAGVPLIGISRYRISIYGKGITTLVAFHGCTLRCGYCLNPQCFGPSDKFPRYTPENLYAELQKDDLYYRATGGGITFGGGEPCLQADFIVRFREICGHEWEINIETSLNVDRESIVKLAPVVDEWIVDIKTDDPEKYLEYTGKDFKAALRNLYYLVNEAKVPKNRILLRIPVIPDYVEEERAESTRQRFVNEGFTRFDIFTYCTEPPVNIREHGRTKCEILRRIREEIAEQNGFITLPPHHCMHEGDCPGTCPRCESELNMLNQKLRQRGNNRKYKISEDLAKRIEQQDLPSKNDEEIILRGDIEAPPELEGQMAEPPQVIHKKIFFKECPIAGLSFHIDKDDELWVELEEGTSLALVRDRTNKHDPNAVAIALADDYEGDPDDFDFDFILGYVPRSENAEIAAMMDAGYADKFSAKITTLKQYGAYNDRIRITIYIESREAIVQRPDLLRAQWLDENEYDGMIAELKDRGFATFRWGGFPLERNLPEAGDKIVMLHKDKDGIGLHLMHVLLKGEDCLKLGLDPDDVFMVDDCVHYALTNIAGPITMPLANLNFIKNEDLKHFTAEEYLTPQASNTFKEIFEHRRSSVGD